MPRVLAPVEEISACSLAHQRLAATVKQLAEDDLDRPSALPAWTRAHVLSHLARNADSVLRRLDAARRGELVEQYVGGSAARADRIDRDARRPLPDVVEDLLATCDAVERAFRDYPPDVWQRPVLLGSSDTRPAAHLPLSRWREVEVHHVDLDLGYRPPDWEDRFVARFLPGVLDSLADRADRRDLLAWGLGRAAAPRLAPWG